MVHRLYNPPVNAMLCDDAAQRMTVRFAGESRKVRYLKWLSSGRSSYRGFEGAVPGGKLRLYLTNIHIPRRPWTTMVCRGMWRAQWCPDELTARPQWVEVQGMRKAVRVLDERLRYEFYALAELYDYELEE